MTVAESGHHNNGAEKRFVDEAVRPNPMKTLGQSPLTFEDGTLYRPPTQADIDKIFIHIHELNTAWKAEELGIPVIEESSPSVEHPEVVVFQPRRLTAA